MELQMDLPEVEWIPHEDTLLDGDGAHEDAYDMHHDNEADTEEHHNNGDDDHKVKLHLDMAKHDQLQHRQIAPAVILIVQV